MNTSTYTGPAYWRDVLTAGGTISPARWTRDPVPGTSVVEAALPGTLVTALDGLTKSMGVRPTAPALAAHARVLASLTGETTVTTGYPAGPADAPLPCRLSTGCVSWRSLILHADRTQSELLAHSRVPLGALRTELGLPETGPAVAFDPDGGGKPLRDAVLQLEVVRRDTGCVLRLWYATELFDEEYATRVVGYHLTALRLIAANPDAAHGRQSLLSPEELRHQTDGLAGPVRPLPDLRFHELFARRAHTDPDTVAAVHGDRRCTYAELDRRANRLAHALLDSGLGRQQVVAVVTERNLDWLVAFLAVLKAGGVYLPIEPHFPAARIAAMLTRAGCGLVLTEPGSTTALDRAVDGLPEVRTSFIGTLCMEDHEESDPGVRVGPDDLAYVIFTSGSTGEPKGAMVEHAGMLNHLFAKIEDLGIGAGDVVAQTAPQCFDISVWQLLAALLAGGRTLLVGQDAVLDVRRFVDTLEEGQAGILQVVPSYLDAVLAFLERHPRALPHLCCVSVTGEALKKDLVRRWFATVPGVPLVNAYGLTETSDDTNHAVLDRVPETESVPLGRPVNNVRVYLLDEHLSPVPLGAPGAIAFAGLCVGRGYINDPDRTHAVFLPDPFHPGARLHLGGDYGRWLPDGQLEFLGRRDEQVKIRGFRVETGEIENALLQVPGVRDGAVVVTGGAERERQLTAFYSGERPLSPDVLEGRLAATLPTYMLPSAFHWLETLPLTANGKIDRRALTSHEEQPSPAACPEGSDGDPPLTPAERRVASLWAETLGIPAESVGRWDNFFDRGGTSLTAVRVAILLDREVSLKALVRHPVLTDLAALLDERSAHEPTTTSRSSR
ncbi:amino acid adenylation domain-containing protein [Streptomyces sp. SID7909]|uniref:non-ribosomal peptide synthetase n=1 Tax=Streptomyces sp. SID7909 TaxID=2706092 RepID=UPI0013B8C7DD|nr:amino acid adenylation domain-containing protein [Streptomyces sp. SID7909]NEC07325.1 amino acid adenylation domain-containing protein [Streptomyces sp. SID7909]